MQDATEIINTLKDRSIRNLNEYYTCYGQPIPISHLLQPYASKLSRHNIEWSVLEDSLKLEGCSVIISPRNKKYVYPPGTLKTLEEMLIEVICIEQEKGRAGGKKRKNKKRKKQTDELQTTDEVIS